MKLSKIEKLRSIVGMIAVCATLGFGVWTSAKPQAAEAPADEPFLEEWVYKVKWGHSEEFFEILKKYQLAILEREKHLGYVTQYTVYAPGLHTSEDQRWDYRVSIVFKNQGAAKHEEEVARHLFPDQQNYRKEENHRWELVEAHWDLPVRVVEVKSGDAR
jgi:hypothetical protein